MTRESFYIRVMFVVYKGNLELLSELRFLQLLSIFHTFYNVIGGFTIFNRNLYTKILFNRNKFLSYIYSHFQSFL